MATRRVSVEISNSAVRMAEVVVGGGRPELVRILARSGSLRGPSIDGVILEPARRCAPRWNAA